MELAINEKYLEAIKMHDGWITVAEWANKVGEMYPDLLETANAQAAAQRNPTTGLKEIAARISSRLSTGGYAHAVVVDESERPRKIKYLTVEQQEQHQQAELLDDIAPLSRAQKIKTDSANLSTLEEYRLAEFESVCSAFGGYLELDFEVDHAKALLNPTDPGRHHPDNLQILLKSHNRMKSSKNWKRFTPDEQVNYLKKVIELHTLIADKANIKIDHAIADALFVRLKNVYGK